MSAREETERKLAELFKWSEALRLQAQALAQTFEILRAEVERVRASTQAAKRASRARG